MRLIRLSAPLPREALLEMIRDNARTNQGVHFDERYGIPRMHVRERGDRLRIRCEMTGRATRDNGFLVGTYFSGRLRERDGVTTLRGVILTSPLYHVLWLVLVGVFIFQCFRLSGFSVVPICLTVFEYFMFRDEFRKQGVIARYLSRAFRRAGRESAPQTERTGD